MFFFFSNFAVPDICGSCRFCLAFSVAFLLYPLAIVGLVTCRKMTKVHNIFLVKQAYGEIGGGGTC